MTHVGFPRYGVELGCLRNEMDDRRRTDGGQGFSEPHWYRRTLDTIGAQSAEGVEWSNRYRKLIGIMADLKTREFEGFQAVLYTWRDRFVESIRDTEITQLVVHRIPTFPDVYPKPAPIKRYTQEEYEWLVKNIPPMEETGIITRCQSPWACKTKWVQKIPAGSGIRMVHQFMQVNAATIKYNYPIRRVGGDPSRHLLCATLSGHCFGIGPEIQKKKIKNCDRGMTISFHESRDPPGE